jgi:hypothetical protein
MTPRVLAEIATPDLARFQIKALAYDRKARFQGWFPPALSPGAPVEEWCCIRTDDHRGNFKSTRTCVQSGLEILLNHEVDEGLVVDGMHLVDPHPHFATNHTVHPGFDRYAPVTPFSVGRVGFRGMFETARLVQDGAEWVVAFAGRRYSTPAHNEDVFYREIRRTLRRIVGDILNKDVLYHV